jgi:hypothetical protein
MNIEQLTLPLSQFSALYLPHSGNVVFYRNGNDLGFMRWADKTLFVVTGCSVSKDLQPVAAEYIRTHALPTDDEAIIIRPGA